MPPRRAMPSVPRRVRFLQPPSRRLRWLHCQLSLPAGPGRWANAASKIVVQSDRESARQRYVGMNTEALQHVHRSSAQGFSLKPVRFCNVSFVYGRGRCGA